MNRRQRKSDPNPQRHMFLLDRLYENREILFSKKSSFAAGLTSGGLSKEDLWEKIRVECVNEGFTELEDKSYKHLRDITWQNYRRRAVAKWEQLKKNPSSSEQLTDCDRMALAIVNHCSTLEHQSAPDYETEEVIEPMPPLDGQPTSAHSSRNAAANGNNDIPHFTPAEIRRIKMEPMGDALLFEHPHYNRGLDESSSFPPPPRGRLFEDDEPMVPTTGPLVNNHINEQSLPDEQMETVENSAVRVPTIPNDDAERNEFRALKRKRQIADIRHMDAKTERLLAEVEKIKAETNLIKMQAAEIQKRLQNQSNRSISGTQGARTNALNGFSR
ncbi:hypothetical protein M3Y98_00204500 [Aphelenchoides besseyi]|nr:hypothetical protein M3Y98_00204500 [Aphelenchoides besseyi]KAI6200329.1 hypothetical protein M3Y96_00722100 [Aphelenchoides besseyi]